MKGIAVVLGLAAPVTVLLLLAEPAVARATCAVKPFAGHRGDSAEHTQSTAAAFDGAYAAYSKIWETDVRFTAGNIPMLLHDATLDAFGSTAEIAHSSYSYVESLRAPDGGQVESLWAFGTQVLAHPGVLALVELKLYPSAAQWARLKSRLDRMGSQVVVAGATAARVNAAKARGYRTALIVSGPTAPSASYVRSYGTRAEVKATLLTPSYAAALKAAGLTVYGWTVNTPAQWQALPAGVIPMGDNPADYRAWYCPNP